MILLYTEKNMEHDEVFAFFSRRLKIFSQENTYHLFSCVSLNDKVLYKIGGIRSKSVVWNLKIVNIQLGFEIFKLHVAINLAR